MRKARVIENCRCYHLISRLAHRAFFLDDDEILRRINVLYRDASLSQVLGEWKRLKVEEENLLEHARPTERYVSRFGEYRKSFIRRLSNRSSLFWPTGR